MKSGKFHIKDAKYFAKYADLDMDIIKSLHPTVNDVLESLDDLGSAPKIPSTLEVHSVKTLFNVDGVCKLQFFKVASDSLPLHEEFYRKYGDSEECNHPLLSLSFDPDYTCTVYKDNYLGKKIGWLQCKICEYRFHECSFMA